ncbi:MAG: hypothetical protein BWY15_02419 [Firmicutes bacterium ADurb.Bin193]|nr:MAG: hypothetical protein BWY15_02419 [Firmicutes bacterium ADurb.Bin193]
MYIDDTYSGGQCRDVEKKPSVEKDYTMFTMRISRKDMAILEQKASRLGMKKAEFIKHLIRLKDLEIR